MVVYQDLKLFEKHFGTYSLRSLRSLQMLILHMDKYSCQQDVALSLFPTGLQLSRIPFGSNLASCTMLCIRYLRLRIIGFDMTMCKGSKITWFTFAGAPVVNQSLGAVRGVPWKFCFLKRYRDNHYSTFEKDKLPFGQAYTRGTHTHAIYESRRAGESVILHNFPTFGNQYQSQACVHHLL